MPPEIVEIEPLLGSAQAVALKSFGIFLHVAQQEFLTMLSRQRNSLGEMFKMNPETIAVAQTEKKIDRAVENAGQDERPLSKRRRSPEKLDQTDSIVTLGQWRSITDLSDSAGRCFSTQPAVRAPVGVNELPFFNPLLNAFFFWRVARQEFGQIGELRSFHLAVQ